MVHVGERRNAGHERDDGEPDGEPDAVRALDVDTAVILYGEFQRERRKREPEQQDGDERERLRRTADTNAERVHV